MTGAILVVGVLFLVGLAVRRFGARIIHRDAADRHGCRRDADRLQPAPGDGLDVLAAGPVDGAAGDAVHRSRGGLPARILVPYRDLPGPDLRLRHLLGLRPVFGKIHSVDASGKLTDHWRLDLSGVSKADWIGLPDLHGPSFQWSAILVALPVVIALVAENAGHVKAVGEMTGDDLDDKLGTAISADGAASMLSTAVGGPPNTTYSENIGVMAATRVYSTAAYWAAAGFALLFGVCPKFGAVVAAIPGGVLGGITVILYGMIGLLGAQIWINAKVDLRNPLNLVPAAAGIIIGVGGVSLEFTDTFELRGIALGTIVRGTGYHALRAFAPAHLRASLEERRDPHQAPGSSPRPAPSASSAGLGDRDQAVALGGTSMSSVTTA